MLPRIGLGSVKLETGWVWLPDGAGGLKEVSKALVPLGVDTWARLWPEWLRGGEGVGNSAVYWAHGSLFAWHLMETWGYLPVLQKAKDGYEARWAPRFVGEARRLFEEYAERMPESARALTFETGAAPRHERRRLIEQTLGWMLDTQARRIAGKVGQKFPSSSIYSKWQTALSHPIAVVQGDKGTIERFHAGILG